MDRHARSGIEAGAVSQEPSCNHLCSAATTDFIIPQRTKLGERAFSVSGPTAWNSLPESLRTVDCIATFKRQLQTQYVNIYLLTLLACQHWAIIG